MFASWRIALIDRLVGLNERWVFERRLARHYRRVLRASPQLVIDVGGNRGQTIRFFRRLDRRCVVHTFEPDPTLFAFLKEHFGGMDGIHLHPEGISDQAGEKLFHENVLGYTSTFERLDQDSAYLEKKARILGVDKQAIVKRSYPVQVTTLREFLAGITPCTVDVLKIDTEGHEHACLAGLFPLPAGVRIRFIQLEDHRDDMYADRVPFARSEALLREHGFTLDARIPHGFGELDDVVFRHTDNV
jgi:FkbM family methyltransferase